VYQPLRSPTSPLRVAKPINHVWKLRSTAFHGAVFCPLVFSTAFFGRPARSASTIFPRKPKTSSQVHSPPPASAELYSKLIVQEMSVSTGIKKRKSCRNLGSIIWTRAFMDKSPGLYSLLQYVFEPRPLFPLVILSSLPPAPVNVPVKVLNENYKKLEYPRIYKTCLVS